MRLCVKQIHEFRAYGTAKGANGHNSILNEGVLFACFQYDGFPKGWFVDAGEFARSFIEVMFK
jgi:hypothetical protein